jgi:hypothetical protein
MAERRLFLSVFSFEQTAPFSTCQTFQRAGVLKMNSGSKGEIMNQPTTPTTPTTQYKCKPPCNKSFKTEAELREHEKTCKGGSGQKKT